MASAPRLNNSGLSHIERGNALLTVPAGATAPLLSNFGLSAIEKGKNSKPRNGATAPNLNRPGSPGGNSPAGGRRSTRKNKSKSKKSKKSRKH